MSDDKCKHRWVAPAWVRTFTHGYDDLPMVCRDCGTFSAMKSTKLSALVVVKFLAQNLGEDYTLQMNTLEYCKLTPMRKK